MSVPFFGHKNSSLAPLSPHERPKALQQSPGDGCVFGNSDIDMQTDSLIKVGPAPESAFSASRL